MTSDQYTAWILAEGFDKPARRKGSELPPRKRISMTDKLAAMLCLMPPRADGTPLIPAEVRCLGAEAIVAYKLDWDHIIARVLFGTDTVDNYRPLCPEDHKPKTKADKKKAAHNARLQREREIAEARRKLLVSAPRAEVIPFPKKPKKPKSSRPMQGGRTSKWKRTMRHGAVLREKRA